MPCGRCAATEGQFVDGLDQGEWYCRECAADNLAISPSRAGVGGSLRASSFPASDFDPPDHLLSPHSGKLGPP